MATPTPSLPTTAALTQELFQLRKRIDTLRFRIGRAKRIASTTSSQDASTPSSPLALHSTLSTAAPRASVCSLLRPAVPTTEKRSIEELEARLEGLKRTHRNLKHIRTLLFNAAMQRTVQQPQPQPEPQPQPQPQPETPPASVVQNEAIPSSIENTKTDIVQPAEPLSPTILQNTASTDVSEELAPSPFVEAVTPANIDDKVTNSPLEIEDSSAEPLRQHQRPQRHLSLSAPASTSTGARSPQRKSVSTTSLSSSLHQSAKPLTTSQCGCGGGGVVSYVINQAASRFPNPLVDLAQAAMALYCFARSLLLPM